MTLDELRALADKFFEWPEGSGRQTVTTFSALLFAQHVLKLREKHEKSLGTNEKSLGTNEKSLGAENSAGVDALRDAAQQALKALEWHLDRGTWGADLDGCAAALRAALEQQVEPVGWLAPDGSVRKTRKPKTFKEWTWGPDAYRPLYAAPPQRKPLTDAEIDALAMDEDGLPNSHLEFARAIERAHGIGEEE